MIILAALALIAWVARVAILRGHDFPWNAAIGIAPGVGKAYPDPSGWMFVRRFSIMPRYSLSPLESHWMEDDDAKMVAELRSIGYSVDEAMLVLRIKGVIEPSYMDDLRDRLG